MQITQQNSQKIYIAARGLRRERGKCQPRYNATPKGSGGLAALTSASGSAGILEQEELLGWFLWHRSGGDLLHRGWG